MAFLVIVGRRKRLLERIGFKVKGRFASANRVLRRH
jgi:hypothetical protein